MARELFIYWRVAPHQAVLALAAAARFQAALKQRHAGLQSRLYRRVAETASEDVTLMETYARPPAGVDAALQADIEAAAAGALAGWCEGQRHVEVFEVFKAAGP